MMMMKMWHHLRLWVIHHSLVTQIVDLMLMLVTMLDVDVGVDVDVDVGAPTILVMLM